MGLSNILAQTVAQEKDNPAKTYTATGKFFLGGVSRLDFNAGKLKQKSGDSIYYRAIRQVLYPGL